MEPPDRFTEEIPSMSDRQIAEFVRQEYALEAMRKDADRMRCANSELALETYRSLPLWLRFKVRIGLLKL